MKYFFILLPVFFSSAAGALDATSLSRGAQIHREWMSVSFYSNIMGNFVSSRAATENDRQETLALDFLPENGCQLVNVSLILNMEGPGKEILAENIYGNVQVDSLPVMRISGKVVREDQSEFVFIEFADSYFDRKLKKGKIILLNFNGWGIQKFSLHGAQEAISKAKRDCLAYAI